MRSGCRPQSELAPLLKDLLRVTPSRLVVVAIVARVQPRASEGHADLASSSPSSPVRVQSRLIRVTGNEGCVRYPTEGNDSCHELTTVSSPLLLVARTILSPREISFYFTGGWRFMRVFLRLKPALLPSHLFAKSKFNEVSTGLEYTFLEPVRNWLINAVNFSEFDRGIYRHHS